MLSPKYIFKSFMLMAVFCAGPFLLHAEESILTIGSIGGSPSEEVIKFQPLADYLGQHLKAVGIESCQVVATTTMVKMAKLLKKGKVDIYFDSPFPAIQVANKSGSEIFLRRWKKGVKEYRSLIFTHKDSGIENLGDLVDEVIAFEEPFSTSAYFLPKATILKQGLQMSELKSPEDNIPDGKIGYVFSEDDEATVLWVARGIVAAGAVNNIDFEELAGSDLVDLTIIKETIDVPRQVVSHRADLDPKIINALKDILVNMDKTEDGQAVLAAFKKTKRFDDFDGDIDAQMNPIINLVKEL
ncbi:MAG: phosphonate transport system substrate-binding protein [Candidatus Omnitrophota bacterium]|jgi:phosphonate transport system substrate-binding protein